MRELGYVCKKFFAFKFADEKGVMQEGKKAVRVTDINLDKAFDLYQKAAA